MTWTKNNLAVKNWVRHSEFKELVLLSLRLTAFSENVVSSNYLAVTYLLLMMISRYENWSAKLKAWCKTTVIKEIQRRWDHENLKHYILDHYTLADKFYILFWSIFHNFLLVHILENFTGPTEESVTLNM